MKTMLNIKKTITMHIAVERLKAEFCHLAKPIFDLQESAHYLSSSSLPYPKLEKNSKIIAA